MIFFANPGRGRPQKAGAGWLGCWGPPLSGFAKKSKNALSSGYQDLMEHLILTTSPWSILTWITLVSKLKADADLLWNTAKQASRPQVILKTQPPICLDYRACNKLQLCINFHRRTQKFGVNVNLESKRKTTSKCAAFSGNLNFHCWQ